MHPFLYSIPESTAFGSNPAKVNPFICFIVGLLDLSLSKVYHIPKLPFEMAAIYSLYIINKSGGLIFYKVNVYVFFYIIFSLFPEKVSFLFFSFFYIYTQTFTFIENWKCGDDRKLYVWWLRKCGKNKTSQMEFGDWERLGLFTCRTLQLEI